MDAECEDVFGDELGLSECFTAHSGTAGAQGLAENACRGRCTPAQSRHIQHGRLLEWQVIAHAGYRLRFDELFGSMGVAAAGADAPRTLYCKEEDKSPGRAAHERNVQGPVVVSGMYRSGLLSNASMKQVQA